MRKAFLLFILTAFIGLQANAQFWKKPKLVTSPLIQPATINNLKAASSTISTVSTMAQVNFSRSRYSCDIEEKAIMKELYHTLRFRMYPEAIDGMNRLVNLYIYESRYSEAKWYLLQCNYFGHKSNNTQAIVNSLVSLGMLKADIGEYDQAKQDLLDAQDICFEQNLAIQATDIDKKLKVVEVKRFANVKMDVQYAEVFETKKDSTNTSIHTTNVFPKTQSIHR